MSKNFALPAAVDFEDRQALRGIDSASLRNLMDECETWFAWTFELGAALTTVSAKTEWKALMQQDAAKVFDALSRLREELEVRQSRLQRLRKEAKAMPSLPPTSTEGWAEAAE